jgi:invasion protein IalB
MQMKILIASILAGSAAFLTMPVSAQAQQQPAPTSAAPAAAAADPVICQKQEVTGSRLATRKVCMKRSQWQDTQLQERQSLEKAQVQRPMSGTTGG